MSEKRRFRVSFHFRQIGFIRLAESLQHQQQQKRKNVCKMSFFIGVMILFFDFFFGGAGFTVTPVHMFKKFSNR